MATITPILTLEAQLKRGLRKHLKELGFTKSGSGDLLPPSDSKESIQHLHRQQREAKLLAASAFISNRWDHARGYLANGCDVVPERIAPRLELIDAETWQSDLFRLVSLSWSIPVYLWIWASDAFSSMGHRERQADWDTRSR